MRDALRVEPVDQALHLRHHFGADAVAGEKQQFMGRHGGPCHAVVPDPVLAEETWMPGQAGMTAECARIARAALRDWQDTIAAARPVQPRPGPATMASCRSTPLQAPDRPPPYAHPARLILILSLAPTVGLGIGRFAYSLVLPDMRDALGWSYSAAGFMNTINAAGYLAGALVAVAAHQALRAVGRGALGNAGLRAVAGAVRAVGQFCRAEFCAAAGRASARRSRFVAGAALAATIAQSRPDAGEFPAEPVLCRTRARHPVVRPDRAVRAAGVRAGIVVDRVVGDDAAVDRA